jgi:ubiquinone/menaquinone biosynthesis C-methylase UbiE
LWGESFQLRKFDRKKREENREIARLEFQHAVWRDDAAEAWRRAGFLPGDTVIDVGAGPGFATLDIATIVGPHGRVIAIDQSQRFLAHLEAQWVIEIIARKPQKS